MISFQPTTVAAVGFVGGLVEFRLIVLDRQGFMMEVKDEDESSGRW